MYPYDIIAGIDLYTVAICIGIVACFFVFSRLSDKKKFSSRLHNLILISGIGGIGLGLFSSMLFQALYNISSRGEFVMDSETGATFYGGLIGGAVCYLLIYFALGHFYVKDRSHLTGFFDMAACVAPAIAVAHGFGRVGCLMAGCCHGSVTDSWCGIMMHGNMGYGKYIPVQLFEAIFLFALAAVLVFLATKDKKGVFSIYLAAYGIWRFFIEYARDDYRGETFIKALTPSQLTAIVLILVGAGLFAAEYFLAKRKKPCGDIREERSGE